MGGQGVQTPPENHKNIGLLSRTGPDPLKNHKAIKPAFNVGPWAIIGLSRPASKTPFKWHFTCGPMMLFECYLNSLSPQKKKLPELDPLGQNFLDPRMVCLTILRQTSTASEY